MAKRGGSELTHENWDQEEEREEAGTFKKAAEGDLKGRVIKRARRRNAGTEDGGEKKNVFSGFGGFSAKQDTSQAFSFLAKNVEPEKPAVPAGGFVFGSVGGAASAKPAQTAGFSFGSQSPGVSKPSFGAFGAESKNDSPAPVFGSFTAEKSTSSSGSTPLFGSKSDTAAPAASFGSFAFGAKKDSTPDRSAEQKTEVSPLISKSVEKTAPAPAFGSGGTFKFGGDSSGKSDAGSSGGLFSFGATASKPPDTKESGSKEGGGFSFGAQPTEEKTSGTTFSFGSTTNKEKSDTGGFSFASKPSEAEKPIGGGFSFGTKASEPSSSKASAGFSFGEKSVAVAAEKPVASSFAFGVKPDGEKQPIGGSFSIGTKSVSPVDPGADDISKSKQLDLDIGSKSEKPVTPIVSNTESKEDNSGELSTEYLSHLKALNIQVLAWLKQHIESNPLVILSPVFKDYDKHLEEITDQFGGKDSTSVQEKNTSSTASASKSDLAPKSDSKSIGQVAFGVPKSSSSVVTPFSFGTSDKPVNSTAPFSFGLAGQQSSTPSAAFGATGGGFGAGGGFSFGVVGAGTNTSNTDSKEAEGSKDEDDEDQPPVVEVKQVEESDAIYDKKCKLFYKKDDRYVEKGVGMLYLKAVEGGKTQLLVRADTNLGNVLLNILLSPQIPTTRVGKNNVMLVCVPNPPVDPKADTSAPCPMLLRVKSGEDADELKAKLDELKEEN